VTSVRGQSGGATAIGVQPSGRLVVAGTSSDCGRHLATLVRYFHDAGNDGGPLMRACSTTVPLEPDGDVPVSVQCPFVEDVCYGSVALEIPPGELSSSSAKRGLKIGAAKFNLASGQWRSRTSPPRRAVAKSLEKSHDSGGAHLQGPGRRGPQAA
jgi:hypothetical protein